MMAIALIEKLAWFQIIFFGHRIMLSFFASEFSCSSPELKVELESGGPVVESAISQIDYINDVISRDQMKVVFFGR